MVIELLTKAERKHLIKGNRECLLAEALRFFYMLINYILLLHTDKFKKLPLLFAKNANSQAGMQGLGDLPSCPHLKSFPRISCQPNSETSQFLN